MWLNLIVDDRQCGNGTKLKKKKPCWNLLKKSGKKNLMRKKIWRIRAIFLRKNPLDVSKSFLSGWKNEKNKK